MLTSCISQAAPPEATAPSRPRQAIPTRLDPSQSLVELLLLLPSLLSDDLSLSRDETELLFSQPPLSDIESLLPSLSSLVSQNLRSAALNLARINHPSTNPSYLHRHINSLAQDVSNLETKVSARRQDLLNARLEVIKSLDDLTICHSQALIHLIRCLEVKHGVVARSLELRASEVCLRAQRTDLEVQQALSSWRREVYTPDVVTALKNYAAHLRDAKIRGLERLRGLQAELGEYGVGVNGAENKEKTMRELAKRYEQLKTEKSDIRGDLQRLQE